MSLKDKFESHPAIWGLSLLVAGGVAGFGARGYVMPANDAPLPAETSCTVEGMPAIEEAHSQRVSALQAQLVSLETKASDRTIISEYQRTYGEAADRIRADIEVENSKYLSAIDTLTKKCK